MAAQDYVAVVEQLYVSYFGRPADYFGLQNFTAQLDALKAPTDFVALNAAVQANKTGPLAALVNSFNSSAESAALYGTDNSQVGISKFVEAIYLNILNRAPDVSGWAFWTGEIVAGRLTRANAAMAITEGALKNTTAQGLLDKASVQNKLGVATNFTAGLDTVTEINAYSGDAAAAAGRGLIKGVDSTTDVAAYQSTVDAAINSIVTGSIPSTNTNLTTNVDTLVGGNGNDTYNAVVGSAVAANDTLNALDSIDGGAGNDTLTVLDQTGGTGLPGGIVIKNVETINFRSAGAVSFNQSLATGVTGVTKLVVGQATTATLTAAATTAVEVKAATGDVTVDGGSNVTVATAGGAGVDVAIGATTVAKGAVSVTNSNQADGNIAIDGGTSVSVTAAGATTGAVTVGQGGAATDLPTGAIAVSVTGAAADGAAPAVRGNITVSGGTKVSVVQSATSDASAAADDIAATTNTITQGDISVTGGKNTTEVSVQQTAAYAGSNATPETVGAKTVDVVTFIKLAANESVTVGGLTFTAAKALTAAQVAAAFAGLTTGSTQGTAPASNGVYSGTFSTKFTSGAVVADGTNQTVTFTTAKADGTATIAVADTSADALLSLSVNETTAGVAHVDAEAGELAVVAGKVTVADSGDKKITTVSIDGFGTGSTVASNALTTLTLAHSVEDLTVTNTTAGALALNINGLGEADPVAPTYATVDLGGAYTAVNITTAGADSFVSVTAGGATAVTVAGTNVADLTGSSFGALKTLAVKGSAGVVADVSAIATVTSVDTTATTGSSTVTIDTATAAFAGGAGADTVNLATTNTTKGVTLGAGNDTLSLFAGTTSLTATMSGGDGTDTLVMDAADAASASGTTAFAGKIDGFEKLSLRAAAADQTIDLANLDNISYVISAGAAATFTETLKNLAANSTVELTSVGTGGTVAAVLADATGTSDVLNVVLKNAGATDFGTVKAAGVETINVTATDTATKTIDTFTLNLNAAAAKSVVVTGNANVTLNGASADVALTSLDGSAMTGKLVASTNGTVAETIKGGSAADTLTAVGNGDTLIGGAGNDKLIVTGNLATLTGGAGNDTFDVSDATSNVNSYATITDLTAGDIIKFADTAATESFKASKVVLADTAVFQDYANAAIAQTAQGEISWFQIGGNTYVIEHAQAGGTSFLNGTDVIVKIAGAVDLSHSSFNAGAGQQTLVYIV